MRESILPAERASGKAKSGPSGKEPARFRVTELPYAFSSLTPVFSEGELRQQFELHRTYVEGLNRLVVEEVWSGSSLEELLEEISDYSTDLRFFAGAHWNLQFFWSIMIDQKENQEMSSELLAAIESKFGTLDEFKNRFIEIGSAHPEPGWVWLFAGENGLEIAACPLQDNPLMDDSGVSGVPLLVYDLWPHALETAESSSGFLPPERELPAVMRRFFAVVNWTHVSEIFARSRERYAQGLPHVGTTS